MVSSKKKKGRETYLKIIQLMITIGKERLVKGDGDGRGYYSNIHLT